MRLLTAFAALLTSLALSTNTVAEPFTFTAIPDQDESQLQQRFDKVARYLEQQLGTPVRYIPVKSYAAAVTAFRNNQVQLAWFGGLSGVQARRRVESSQAIAQGFEDQLFKTYFIAHKSTGLLDQPITSNITPLVKGATFTFGSKGSTSGRLMPEYYLREQFNAAPQDIFRRVGFSGDHSRTIALVQSAAFDIGAVNYQVWETAVAQGKVDTKEVNVIWTTPTYPDYQWTIRGDVDQQWGEGFSAKVKNTLINITDQAILDAFPRQSFISATNADYEPIEKTAVAIGLIDE